MAKVKLYNLVHKDFLIFTLSKDGFVEFLKSLKKNGLDHLFVASSDYEDTKFIDLKKSIDFHRSDEEGIDGFSRLDVFYGKNRVFCVFHGSSKKLKKVLKTIKENAVWVKK